MPCTISDTCPDPAGFFSAVIVLRFSVRVFCQCSYAAMMRSSSLRVTGMA